MMFLSSLQSHRAAQHQSHRLCQSCHPQSAPAPVSQLIGAAGCRSCRDWSVCSLISCNPLVIPLGSNISISSYLPPRKHPATLPPSYLVLMLGIRAENTLLFHWDDVRHNSSRQSDFDRQEEAAPYKASIRVSGTRLTMTDKFGAKNQTFLKKFDAETRSLFILLVTDLVTSFSICKYQEFIWKQSQPSSLYSRQSPHKHLQLRSHLCSRLLKWVLY